ncbi:MAG: GDP-L-fucose synthase [Deltaproteobacteria bacterium]|nr:GDP-L-fucose synthase [Deltaproteobacteria bacterium]
MRKDARIFVAGHKGLVGSAIIRTLQTAGYEQIITCDHQHLDLTCQAAVTSFFEKTQPEYVVLAAAKVGGIWANNTRPAEFIYDNLAIETHVIHAAWKTGVRRLLFLGSSCIYPRDCPQPIKEEYLLTGPLEPTNEPYAIAKIAGIKLCQSYNRQYGTQFYSVMPTNLFGPNDNFDLETSHVLPALIRKFHEAKIKPNDSEDAGEVEIWGTGTVRREFLHVDDLAGACLFMMNLGAGLINPLIEGAGSPLVNIGWGQDITIAALALLIKDIVGFTGSLRFDTQKPDGTPRKLLDVGKITDLGWQPEISLEDGIRETYAWCLENKIF